MYTDEQLKQAWERGYNAAMANLGSKTFDPNRRTAMNRLADRYKRFTIIGIMGIACCLMWTLNPMTEYRVGWLRVALPVIFVLYFLFGIAADQTLYHRLRDINIYRLSTTEVLSRVVRIRKFHLQSMMIMIPAMILIIGVLVWNFIDNLPMMMGMAFGFVVGLSIGIVQFMRFMSDYREIMRDLEE